MSLRIHLKYEDGHVEVWAPVGRNDVVQELKVEVDHMPIIVVPFYIHGERLHTICSRRNEENPGSESEYVVREIHW